MNATEALGIIIATVVALLLRWGTDKWPGPKDAAARRQERLLALQEQVEIRRLEQELHDLGEDQ